MSARLRFSAKHQDARPLKARRDFDKAVACQRSGDDDEASRLYTKLLKHHPEHFDALAHFGLLKLQQGQSQRALDLLTKAIKLEPRSLGVLNALGVIFCNLARFDEAVDVFRRMLALDSSNPHTHNNIGNTFAELRRFDDASAAYDRALELKSNFAESWLGRGNILLSIRRYDDALTAVDMALQFNPTLDNAWISRGNALTELKRYDEALAAYREALALEPNSVKSWLGLGNLSTARKDYDAAIAAFDKALAIKPDFVPALLRRGRARCLQGDTDEGTQDYQRAIDLGGDEELVRFELAQFGSGPAPAATPKSLIVSMFDSYADGFDNSLVNQLQYQTPVELFALISRETLQAPLNVLDLGCGTGLMGAQIRASAATLTGVDLSARMLKKAGQRSIYDRLACGDITEFLTTNTDTYGLVVCADVFIYFGELEIVFTQVRRALDARGLFGFSVEATDEGECVLRQTGRYAHSESYLRRLSSTLGFAVERIEPTVLRKEFGADIRGFNVLLRRQALTGDVEAS